jgi:hypothetical protein
VRFLAFILLPTSRSAFLFVQLCVRSLGRINLQALSRGVLIQVAASLAASAEGASTVKSAS